MKKIITEEYYLPTDRTYMAEYISKRLGIDISTIDIDSVYTELVGTRIQYTVPTFDNGCLVGYIWLFEFDYISANSKPYMNGIMFTVERLEEI